MIPLFKVLMTPEAAGYVANVLGSGHIAQGPRVDEFEHELAKAMVIPADNVVTVNSGTSAIHLALVLAGVKPGDDVAVTPMTCAATIAPIVHLGARPLWIDIDPETGLMDPQSLHWRLTSNTTAVVAVDWAGKLCDYDAIHGAAIGLPVIQDAAHAFLARDSNNQSISRRAIVHDEHFVCYSFQAIKHLTTGDGGALICHSKHAERARKLRWFGFDRRSSSDFRCAQNLDEAGYKFHMNDIAAAIGLANLPEAIECVQRHRDNAQALCEMLAGLAHVWVPEWDPGSSWWIFPLLVEKRDAFIAHMKHRGIEASQVHRRNDAHTVFHRAAGWHRELTNLNSFAARQVNIPCGWWLSMQDIAEIVEAVRTFTA